MTSWAEKRQYQRAYVKLRVECRGKSFWQYVETHDISAGGMFVATDKVEPPQTKVEVMFEFGEEEKKFIHAEGVVAWSRAKPFKDPSGELQAAGMGVMFTKITPASGRNYIDQMVKKTEEKKDV
jgi:uncharacterized protein (TIGR02266 family)